MKRLFAVILFAAMLAVSLGTMGFAAEETVAEEAVTTKEVSSDLQEAKDVIDVLTGEELFQGEMITRADFVSAMLKFMQITPGGEHEYIFTDVPSFAEFAQPVYTAAEMGWISKGTNFEPKRAITPNEALKIVVRMLNYEVVAQNKGGYPSGDLYVARQLDLLNDIDMSAETLTVEDAYLLLHRAAFVPTFQQLIYGNEEKYIDRGETLAYRAYKAYEVEGIVSRTPYNALDGEEAIGKGSTAEIDGVVYDAEEVSWDMLGVQGRAVIKENEKGGRDTLLYLHDMSERRTISLDDIEEKNGNTIEYWTEGAVKTKSLRLSKSVPIILNGRKLAEGVDECFTRAAGNLILADNNEDGLYDVVFVNRYSYAVALNYDSVTETFRDKYTSSATFSFNQKAVILQNEYGETMDPLSISEDEVYRVICSKDKGFIHMQKLEEAVTGIVNRINLEEKTLTLDKTEYIMSDYFIENFVKQVDEVTERKFCIDRNVIVSVSDGSSDMRYGYMLGCKYTGAFSADVTLRVYTQEGEFKELKLAPKTIFDGQKGKKPSEVYAALNLGGSVTPQLIKYGLSGDGEVRCLDTATTTLPAEAGVYADKNDTLTHYDKLSVNLCYSGSTKAMGAMYNVSGSVVFCIPTDITKEENFVVRGSDFFVHGNWYTFQVYDLDKAGMAGALIYSDSTGTAYSVHPDNPYMIISEIVTKLNDEGEMMYEIYGWRGGSFITVDMDENFASTITKTALSGTTVDSTHNLLSGGDVIGIATDKNSKLKAINIVYDARRGVMASNVSSMNSGSRTAPMYHEGIIYKIEGDYAVISIRKGEDGWDFSQDSLRYIKLPTSNMASYNAKTGQIRPMTASDIKTYKTDGADAHYGVFCQSNFEVKTAVFYEDMEARR